MDEIGDGAVWYLKVFGGRMTTWMERLHAMMLSGRLRYTTLGGAYNFRLAAEASARHKLGMWLRALQLYANETMDDQL